MPEKEAKNISIIIDETKLTMVSRKTCIMDFFAMQKKPVRQDDDKVLTRSKNREQLDNLYEKSKHMVEAKFDEFIQTMNKSTFNYICGSVCTKTKQQILLERMQATKLHRCHATNKMKRRNEQNN